MALKVISATIRLLHCYVSHTVFLLFELVSQPVVIAANCRRKLETPFSWSTSFISFNYSWNIPFNLLNYQSQKNKTHQKIRPLKCLALEHLERVLFFFLHFNPRKHHCRMSKYIKYRSP